jgi:hypothetical protein
MEFINKDAVLVWMVVTMRQSLGLEGQVLQAVSNGFCSQLLAPSAAREAFCII